MTTQIDYITLYHCGKIHVIQREPYETNIDVYKRGWFMIHNKERVQDALKLMSISLMEIYKNKGMVYEM